MEIPETGMHVESPRARSPSRGTRADLTRARLLALVGAVLISFNPILFRLSETSPLTAAFFRAAYALPFLVILAWHSGLSRIPRRAWFLAFPAGVLLAMDLGLWHRAIEQIGAGLATVVVNIQVAIVGLAAWALHGERPKAIAFMLVPMILVGTVLITGVGRSDAYGVDPVGGVVSGLTAAVAYAGFLLLFRASNMGVAKPASTLAIATFGICVALFATLPVGLGLDLRPTWPAHGWLGLMAIGGGVVGWLAIASAMPRLPALETSIVLILQPALSVFWGAAGFGEHISSVQWSGVGLVLASIAVLAWRGSVHD